VPGAVPLTGHRGGAVAPHVRAGHGAVEALFPVAFGALRWLGLGSATTAPAPPWSRGG
jgi:hypothetical protein